MATTHELNEQGNDSLLKNTSEADYLIPTSGDKSSSNNGNIPLMLKEMAKNKFVQLSEGEEDSIAEDLRKAFANNDLQSEGTHLEEMGSVYLERGKITKNGMDFVKAAGLYNAALARCSHNTNAESIKSKLINCIELVEAVFITNCLIGKKYKTCSFEDILSKHKAELESIRNQSKQKLEDIIKNLPAYEEDHDEDTLPIIQKSRNMKIYEIYKEISAEMREFAKKMINECLEVLGEPPCEFAFIGLGSLATEVMTPYSDLEGAILIDEVKDSEENKQYFRNLTYLLYIKTINLGETIVPTLNIRSLCKSNSFVNWFGDFVTPRGFSMDGQVPWACKTPLGKTTIDKDSPVELIGTPLQISLFCSDANKIVGYNLPSALLNTVLIQGSETLFKQYNNLLNKSLSGDSAFKIKHSITKMISTVVDFGISKQFDADIIHRKSDVKKDAYRMPNLIILTLGRYYNIFINNPWEIAKELEKLQAISTDNMHHLFTILSIVGELRLMAYFFQQKQGLYFSGLPYSSTRENSIYHVRKKMLIHLYYRLLPLEKTMIDFLGAWISEKVKRPLDINFKIVENVLYDNSKQTEALIQEKLFDLKKAEFSLKEHVRDNPEDIDALYNLASLYIDLGDANKAKEIYQQNSLSTQERQASENLRSEKFIIMIMVNLAIALYMLGDYKKAILYYENSFVLAKEEHGESGVHSDIAAVLSGLGKIWGDLGDYKKALEYNERSLEMRKQFYGENAAHPDIAESFRELGNTSCDLGKHIKAKIYYEKSLAIRKKFYGESAAHPNVADCLNDLGFTWGNLGDHKKAKEYYELSLTMRKQLYGEYLAHPSIASSLNNLAWSLEDLGDFKNAIKYHEECLAMRKKLHGYDASHPTIADSFNNLGSCWSDLGENEKAIKYFMKSLAMKRSLYGENVAQPTIAHTLNNLGNKFGDLGDFEKAVKYHKDSLEMRKQLFGNHAVHPHIASSLNNFGAILNKMGEYEEALNYAEESLVMNQKLYGENTAHPDIAFSLHNIGVNCYELGDYEEAVKYVELSLAMKKELYGEIEGENEENRNTADSLEILGNCWRALGKQKKAKKYYEKSLATRKKYFGKNAAHPSIALSLNNLGVIWGDMGDYNRAIEYHEKSLEMRKQVYGESAAHPDIAASLNNLGSQWRCLDNYKKAIVYYEKSNAMKKRWYGENVLHPDIAITLYNLGICWSDLGVYSTALQYFQRAMGIIKHKYGNVTHPHVTKLRNYINFVLSALFLSKCNQWVDI